MLIKLFCNILFKTCLSTLSGQNALRIREKWIVSGQQLLKALLIDYGYNMYNINVLLLAL